MRTSHRLVVWCWWLPVLATLACLPVTWARWTGGTSSTLVTLLAALVPLTLGPLAVASAVGAGLGVAALRGGGRGVGAPAARAVAAFVVPVLLLALHLTWAAPSLLGTRPARVEAAASTGSPPPRPLRVMSLNMYLGEADAAAAVRAVRDRDVDVFVALELTPEAVARLDAAGLSRLLPQHVLEPFGGASGGGLWTRLPMTPLPRVPGTIFAWPRALLTGPGDVPWEVTVVHAVSPTQGTTDWQRELAHLAEVVRADRRDHPQWRPVVLGDFNATRDHAPMRAVLDAGLVDAADVPGVFGLHDAGSWLGLVWPGLTWPADRHRLPPVMRLDHVLVGDRTRVDASGTVQVPGTDHRAVWAAVGAGR